MIKKLRKKLNLTQRDISNQLNVTPHAISQWENGKRNPSLENVKRLSKILHCTVDEILKGELENE